MKALVHIAYIKNTSQLESFLDNVNVSIDVSPKFNQINETVFFPLKNLDILSNKNSWYFNIQKYESQSLLITVSETNNNNQVKQISNLIIPFSTFPPGQSIKNEFKMNSISPLSQPLSILLEVYVSNSKLLSKDSNMNAPLNFKKHLINKTILQPNTSIQNNQFFVQPRKAENISSAAKNRQLSLPISTFNTFNNQVSETDESANNELSETNYSESSVESVALDLSSSSSSEVNRRDDDDDSSSSSYLSESSQSDKDTNPKQTETTKSTLQSTGTEEVATSENKEKRHKHHHRHHHHHHKHHQHHHSNHKHHHRHHHHHHHHQTEQPRQEQRRQLRQQQSNINVSNQRMLRAHIRTIASDRNIYKKRVSCQIPERQSTRLPTYKPSQSNEKNDNPFLQNSSLLI